MVGIIAIGYNKDFTTYKGDSIVVYEAMSDRIDYIRNNSLDKKFVLIPKFIHSGGASLRKVYIERRLELPLRNFRKKNLPFLHVEKDPFYNSREIEVSCIPLCDVKTTFRSTGASGEGPISTLFINYGNIEDIIKSAGNKFYRFNKLYIHKDIPLNKKDNVLLERYFFYPNDTDKDNYIHYLSQKPQLEVQTIRYSQLKELLQMDPSGLCIICPDSYDKSKLPSLYRYNPYEIDDNLIFIESDDSKICDIFMFSSTKNIIKLAKCILDKKITVTNKLRGHLNLKIFLKE